MSKNKSWFGGHMPDYIYNQVLGHVIGGWIDEESFICTQCGTLKIETNKDFVTNNGIKNEGRCI